MDKKINELFFMRPWAIKEDVLLVLAEIIERHLKGEKLSATEIDSRVGGDKKEAPGYEVINGTAHIPIYGVISKRSSMVRNISQPQGTSVQDIEKNFKAALGDPAVNKILFEIDSPGGNADGVTELSDLIYSNRGKKPIVSFANGQMDSAAYWIGSAADKVYASKSSEVGGIGVYTVVNDWSVANHNAGIKTEIIKAGKYKAAGHPDKHLTEDDRAAIQEEVNAYYELFVEAVTRNRGMSAESIEKTANGKVFIGQKALNAGLIDGIATLDSFLPISACNDDDEKKKKKTEVPPLSAAAQVIEIQKKEDKDMDVKELTLEALKKERPDLLEAAAKEAKEGAVKQERARVVAIIDTAKDYQDAGVEDVVRASIESGDDLISAESKFKDKKLEALKKEAPKSPGPADDPTKVAKSHLERAKAYKDENKCSLTEALRATAEKRK
ncbi:MAG: signal peptide peptidase SppA [Candidatus Omnitrophica bacterium]|nr:signal peptide peptidase SppA [Candidatus Omnitrophota bacterium]